MMNIEGLTKYLEDTGLAERIEKLKPNESFGVEIPIDEDNNKWLRFWLSTEGEGETVEYVTVDFEGIFRVRVVCDEKKLDKWAKESGILELVGFTDDVLEADEKTE